MSRLQPVRGTRDLLPDDCRRHRHVSDTARAIAERYGYGEIATPIFEFTEVFKRTLGETSDIVTKEMYTFADRGGELLTLRPENTAGVARAFISGELGQLLPLKFFYVGPMFRHERPQKGRLRQFHQIGVELIGVPEPLGDVEVIGLGTHILDALGVLGRTKLELNTLGDTESRQAYRAALREFLGARRNQLSPESQERLERNPMRILDSKDEGDRKLIQDAPRNAEFLNSASADFFKRVRDGLDAIGVRYEINPFLVRGLDYYGHSAFEFTTTELGAQSAVLAGGRYDGLIETMGGPPTAGVGWAAGIERLAMLVADPLATPRPIALVPVGPAGEATALMLAAELRRAGFNIDLGYRGNMSKRMKRANQTKARVALMIGDDELAKGVVTLRDLDSGTQETVERGRLAERLAAFR
ncbi:MAG: histidine--tRNA ligase [Alphaproteobacteria bacterium]|nr:histidine--tRNA ligase [Alphaproteobacteria bacterium]